MTKPLPFQRLAIARVMPVVMINEIDEVTDFAQVVSDGNIKAVELALRNPAALDMLRAMRLAAPEVLLGAGTVLTPDQASAAKAAGADFALAPGLDAATVRHCSDIGLPFIPGVATPSDVQAAVALGCRVLKFFPAEALGGVRGLRILAAPFAHLGVRYLPLGGIGLSTSAAYLAEPCVAAVGGSWIAPPELIRCKAWTRIRQNAIDAADLAAASPFFSA